jgi:hypothetical protein
MHPRRSRPLSTPFEHLEPRIVLSAGAGLDCVVYAPEGFAHNSVTEVVTISNAGNTAADFELFARYEVGERDQTLASGFLAPGETREIEIARAGEPDDRLVRGSTPFALELRSSDPLAATLRHDDFGGVTVQPFSDVLDDTWTFARSVKNAGDDRDFIVFYNPGDADVTVTLTGIGPDGSTFDLVQTVGALRRGGWNLMREPGVPQGEFGLALSASAPIIVSRSHYEPTAARAFQQIGQAGGGAVAGAILNLEFERRLVDGGGDDDGPSGDDDGTPDQGPGDATHDDLASRLSILNTGDSTATIVFSFFVNDDDLPGLDIPAVEVEAPAARTTIVSLLDLGLPENGKIGMLYASDVPVTISAEIERGGSIFGTTAVTSAASAWTFASGAVDRVRDGVLRTEDVFLLNPGLVEVEVTIVFTFSDGRSVTEVKSLDPFEIEDVRAEILVAGAEGLFFTISVLASAPVVSSLERFDPLTGDGFVSPGLAGGDVVSLADLL